MALINKVNSCEQNEVNEKNAYHSEDRKIRGRLISVNHFGILLLITIMGSTVADPETLDSDLWQGPMVLPRIPRGSSCISAKTGEVGFCTFAIDCTRANGTHMGTCRDRFYFGSCCRIKTKSPQNEFIDNIDASPLNSFTSQIMKDRVQTMLNKGSQTNKDGITKFNSNRNKTSNGSSIIDNRGPENEIETSDTKEEIDEDVDTITTQEPYIVNQIEMDVPNESAEPLVDQVTPNAVQSTMSSTTQLSVITIKPTTTTTTEKPSTTTTLTTTTTTTTEKPSTTTTTTTEKPSTTTTTTTTTRKPFFPDIPPFRPLNFLVENLFKPKPAFPLYNMIRLPYEPISSATMRPLSSTTASLKPSSLNPLLNIHLSTTVETSIKSLQSDDLTTISMDWPENENAISSTILPDRLSNEIDKEETLENTTLNSLEEAVLSTPDSNLNIEAETTEGSFSFQNTELDDIQVVPQSTTSVPYPSLETWTSTEFNTVSGIENSNDYENLETVEDSSTTFPTTNLEVQDTTSTPVKYFTAMDSLEQTTDILTQTTPYEKDSDLESMVTTESSPTSLAALILPNSMTAEVSTPITIAETKLPGLVEGPIVTSPSDLTLLDEVDITETSSIMATEATTDLQNESVVTTSNSISSFQQGDLTVTFSSFTTERTNDFTESFEFADPEIATTTLGSITMQPVLGVTNEPPLTSTTENSDVVDLSYDEFIDNEFETESEFEVDSVTDIPFETFDYDELCGLQLWPDARVVGGNDSTFGQWPWTISLRRAGDEINAHSCGAALINENWAITAAHCVVGFDPSEFLLRLGEYDTTSEDEPYGFIERNVQLIASHPLFDSSTFENDLALLRFVERVPFQPNILPVCIPDSDDDFVGQTAHVTGWGRTAYGGPTAEVMQEVEVPIITNSECEAMYMKAGYNESVPHIFICAGYQEGGFDSCEGDSGGPMVIQRESDNRYVLSGIISWGIKCGDPNKPGVYTRISDFRDWINQIIQF